MQIRVIYFNKETISKRSFKLTFTWDYINHCWLCTVSDSLGYTRTERTSQPPEQIVNIFASNRLRSNEYVTIKRYN